MDKRGGAASRRVLREAWTGAAEGWRATPSAVRRRFFVILGITALIAVGASVLAAIAGRLLVGEGLLPGDAELRALIHGRLDVHSALWLGAFTSSAMVVPVLAAAAVLAARAGYWERTVLAVVAFAGSKAIILGGWLVWSRPRPGDVAGGVLIPGDMPSFPSGHTVQAWTVYGLLALWWIRASDRTWEKVLALAAVFIGSLVVGAARVRIGAHNPSDVIAGVIFGAIWLFGVARAEGVVRGRRASGRGGSPGGQGTDSRTS